MRKIRTGAFSLFIFKPLNRSFNFMLSVGQPEQIIYGNAEKLRHVRKKRKGRFALFLFVVQIGHAVYI